MVFFFLTIILISIFFFYSTLLAGESLKHLENENVYDALLLNTLRIGHGFQYTRFSGLLPELKKREIAIECSAISN